MILHAERRQREQSHAWESMEKRERQREVETGQAKAETEAFVTDSYRRQMEINKDGALATEVEERLNAQKTANAETGMMGFYKNLMTKNKAVGSSADVALDKNVEADKPNSSL